MSSINDSVQGSPETTSGTPRTPLPEQDRRGPRTAAGLRPLALRLHFYAGLLVAPFLLVAAATGLLYAASYQVEKVLYAHELRAPVPGDGSVRPLSEQVEAAHETRPESVLTAVRPSTGQGETTRVLFSDPELGESESAAVFVDPYTAEVRGELVSYGSSGALPVRAWISELHRHLHLGEPGRLYSETAASWLWVVALGGLLLWIGRGRASSGVRGLLLPERGTTGRRRTLGGHGAVGLWALLGLLFLSATGLTWSTYAGANIDELRSSLRGATPAVSTALESGGAAGGGHGDHGGRGSDSGTGQGTDRRASDIGVDRVWEAAQERGLTGPVEITVPADGKTAYAVAQTDKQWPVHLDSVAVHPVTGAVADEVRFDDFPLLAKLSRWGIDAHMGLLFGLANQLVLIALALGIILLIVWGYRMWWLRRPTRDRLLSAGRPMPRGAWRRVPLPLLAALGAAAVVVGWFLPLFGIGLVAFLAVDAVRGAVARGRS